MLLKALTFPQQSMMNRAQTEEIHLQISRHKFARELFNAFHTNAECFSLILKLFLLNLFYIRLVIFHFLGE
jgi:hypothetical protein